MWQSRPLHSVLDSAHDINVSHSHIMILLGRIYQGCILEIRNNDLDKKYDKIWQKNTDIFETNKGSVYGGKILCQISQWS